MLLFDHFNVIFFEIIFVISASFALFIIIIIIYINL